MTQEQKIKRGSIVIFVLSIVLFLCLCLTATLAYFAGSQSAEKTLILGGPVRVKIVDNLDNETAGEGQLTMRIKTGRAELLPGMGIDMQAIAKVSSSRINSTRALLRARLDIDVTNLSPERGKEVEKMIRDELAKCLTFWDDGVQDGWLLHTDGNFYYCNRQKGIDDTTGEQYIELLPIDTSYEGNNIPFINGTFQFPGKFYTNPYANAEIVFNLTFEAIQEVLVDDDGNRVVNSVDNVKNVLDSVDWEKHREI